jgi:alkylated DNA repair dioxygenase AlkB
MDGIATDRITNLLPYDGTVYYFGKVLPTNQADCFFQELTNTIAWQHDKAVIFGKHITTKRKVAWYADVPYAYTYSGVTKTALPWTEGLLQLKRLAENITQATYNSCLLNLYHSGEETMGWHSDDEKSLAREQAIASLSFGAERKFSFKHKRTGETVSLLLEHGSMLVMRDATQTNWLHRLPPTKRIATPRINLTFRTMLSHPVQAGFPAADPTS